MAAVSFAVRVADNSGEVSMLCTGTTASRTGNPEGTHGEEKLAYHSWY